VDDELHYDSGLPGYWWKPSFSYIENMPAFVPMFEMTVFFTWLLYEVSYGFKQAENPDVRTTDDHS
jgi:hypothetical protein